MVNYMHKSLWGGGRGLGGCLIVGLALCVASCGVRHGASGEVDVNVKGKVKHEYSGNIDVVVDGKVEIEISRLIVVLKSVCDKVIGGKPVFPTRKDYRLCVLLNLKYEAPPNEEKITLEK